MIKQMGCGAIAFILIVAGIVLANSAYTVHETKQVLITQFGKPVGEPKTEAGLHFRLPFVHKVNEFDKRILEWDGKSIQMPTQDKLFIVVDTFGRWRIKNALKYFERLRDERSAESRLEDILGSETRNAVAKHKLIEIIRTTKDRELPAELSGEEVSNDITMVSSGLLPISKGRALIEKEIMTAAKSKLEEFGIELLDVRFKRVNYNKNVQEKIYDRMISERQQIAERFRSEGAGEAAKILGNKERDLQKIESEAYKAVQMIRGKADAEATRIYAESYDQSPEARDLYSFIKTMETYKSVLGQDTTMMLSTDSELFNFLQTMHGNGKAGAAATEGPVPQPAGNQGTP